MSTPEGEKITLPDPWEGERNLLVSVEEAQSWIDALEPLLTEGDRKQDARMLERSKRIGELQREIKSVQEEIRDLHPAWGTTLGFYWWSREIRDYFMDDRGTAMMREAIVHGIVSRIEAIYG